MLQNFCGECAWESSHQISSLHTRDSVVWLQESDWQLLPPQQLDIRISQRCKRNIMFIIFQFQESGNKFSAACIVVAERERHHRTTSSLFDNASLKPLADISPGKLVHASSTAPRRVCWTKYSNTLWQHQGKNYLINRTSQPVILPTVMRIWRGMRVCYIHSKETKPHM